MKRFAAFLFAILVASPLYAGTRDLKQSTAVTIVVGPFVDTAGAAVTAPTIASIDITAYKNDGTAVTITPAASGTSNDMVHVDDGYYSLELTTTDTGTAGYLRMSFQISGALIFHEDFNVLPANIYDSKYSTDKLEVDVVQISSDTTAADNLESASDGTGYNLGGGLIVTTTKVVADAIKVVTDQLVAAQSEPTGVPAANETPLEKIGYIFMALRNGVTVTATNKTFLDDSGAGEWKKPLSDDGTTYTEAEAASP